jgi:excisionase family DNA binding protein
MNEIRTGLLTEAELADALGICRRTLIRWRMARKGPPHVQLGRGIRYRAADVQDWLAENVVDVGRHTLGAP